MIRVMLGIISVIAIGVVMGYFIEKMNDYNKGK